MKIAKNGKWAAMEIGERQVLQQKLLRMKCLEEYKKKQEAEIKQCTFHPTLIANNNNRSRQYIEKTSFSFIL